MSTWREVIEYDPLTGVRTDFFSQEDGTWGVQEQQDMTFCKKLEDAATELRNDDDYRKTGIKNSMMHAATVPQWVYSKIITDYNIPNPLARGEEVLKIVQRDFPWCMTAKGRY